MLKPQDERSDSWGLVHPVRIVEDLCMSP